MSSRRNVQYVLIKDKFKRMNQIVDVKMCKYKRKWFHSIIFLRHQNLMGTQTYQCVTLMAAWIPQDVETMIRRCLGDHFPQFTTLTPLVFSSCFSSSLASYPSSLTPRYSIVE